MSRRRADYGRARLLARSVLGLALGASLAANVLASEPTAVARAVAAWPPLALMLSVELIARVPGSASKLSRLRYGAAALIASVAAWVSYSHMRSVALTAGEGPVAAALIPLVVDGLVAVASITLAEVARQEPPRPAAKPDPQRRSTTKVDNNGSEPTAVAVEAVDLAEVVALANERPEATQAELADVLGCSERTIRRKIAKAREAGLIEAAA